MDDAEILRNIAKQERLKEGDLYILRSIADNIELSNVEPALVRSALATILILWGEHNLGEYLSSREERALKEFIGKNIE